tara:strand:- start:279 stop:698 length:420 start_codon:yes stop_codon:yes gene_type:complete
MELTQNAFLRIELQENDVLLFTTLKSEITEEEWLECQQMVDKWYQYGKENNLQLGILLDMTSISFLKSKFYISWKDKYFKNKENTEKYVFGVTILIHNFIIRRFINCFFTIYRLSKPFKVVKSIEEGYDFLEKHNPNTK